MKNGYISQEELLEKLVTVCSKLGLKIEGIDFGKCPTQYDGLLQEVLEIMDREYRNNMFLDNQFDPGVESARANYRAVYLLYWLARDENTFIDAVLVYALDKKNSARNEAEAWLNGLAYDFGIRKITDIIIADYSDAPRARWAEGILKSNRCLDRDTRLLLRVMAYREIGLLTPIDKNNDMYEIVDGRGKPTQVAYVIDHILGSRPEIWDKLAPHLGGLNLRELARRKRQSKTKRNLDVPNKAIERFYKERERERQERERLMVRKRL